MKHTPLNSDFYVPRTISAAGKEYTESQLLDASECVIVLAEPGAGKSRLMHSLASQMGEKVTTASTFVYSNSLTEGKPLFIDAIDELPKTDSLALNQLLGKASQKPPSRLYISSRSSEWDEAASILVENFFSKKPLVAHLREFSETEQELIFRNHLPSENFTAFRKSLSHFDLEPLLSNPLFLKLFADSYIENGRLFTNKHSIFEKAVERLAREANQIISSNKQKLTSQQKIDIAGCVFTKLLLSGSEGVSSNEAAESRTYPYLGTISEGVSHAHEVLSSQLFKPGDAPSHHLPAHKIIAEYCAARHLVKRFTDRNDPLTLSKCLAIIAPNSVARTELRGLLGWIATLGDGEIAKLIISIDPYSVLSNGDPSLLDHDSKVYLIENLVTAAEEDPYFRKGDYFRKFSARSFFTDAVIEEVKPLLSTTTSGQLRNLILELLAGSSAIEKLQDELIEIVLSHDEDSDSRELATSRLLEVEGLDFSSILSDLMTESSQTSLQLISAIILEKSPKSFDNNFIAKFLRTCSCLYDTEDQDDAFTIGSRFFLRSFIWNLNGSTVEELLHELTKDIICTCGMKHYRCKCRHGISKVGGFLLDRYFEIRQSSIDPHLIWNWTKDLWFENRIGKEQSASVRYLQENDDVRRRVYAEAFMEMSDPEKTQETIQRYRFGNHCHSGLALREGDSKFMTDLAYESENPDLWVIFYPYHFQETHNQSPETKELRQRMRQQARLNPKFMRKWASTHRYAKANKQKCELYKGKFRRFDRKRNKRSQAIQEKNDSYFKNNRATIEAGNDFPALSYFSNLFLYKPDQIKDRIGDHELVNNALRNCIGFIETELPSLRELAANHCALEVLVAERVLYAACIEIMRNNGSLSGIKTHVLQILRVNLTTRYPAISEEEHQSIKEEVDRIIFPTNKLVEDFLRQYYESQLSTSRCNIDFSLLRQLCDELANLRGELSIDWIKRFPKSALQVRQLLFDIAAEAGMKTALEEIIHEQLKKAADEHSSENEKLKGERKFWLIRALYFLKNPPNDCWELLKEDKNIILELSNLSHGMHGHIASWPKLDSRKIESILNIYINIWPSVPLPNCWGSHSPQEETAFRFLDSITWGISADNSDETLSAIDRMLSNQQLSVFHERLKHFRTEHLRKKAHESFTPPSPQKIVSFLDQDEVITVEILRRLIMKELENYQKDIFGGEFNPGRRFYQEGKRIDEIRSCEIIAERLSLTLKPFNIQISNEHQLKNTNRSDFTASKMISGRRCLLVTEVKGQWHQDLYTAASSQLHDRYSIHPDAEQQGIFIVLWFGPNEKVANRKRHDITCAHSMRERIISNMPKTLIGLIDVFVLDLSEALS